MTINNNLKGFFLVDKPLHLTSFDVLRQLRKKTGVKKMGHTGTLDPLASGLLLVAIGDYTKLIPYFEKDVKEYEFSVCLDGTTESLDLEKEVQFLSAEAQEKFKNEITLEKIQEVLKTKFLGEIFQTPPKYSAIKIGGQKAMHMVRNGEEFEMKQRKVTIYNIEIISYKYPVLTLKASVSAGTYIRSIAYDLGEIFKTGGYISYLRRTKIGNLDLTLSKTLDDFDINSKLDDEILFGKDKFISLPENILERINHGLKQKFDTKIEKSGEYFIKKDNFVTNIISINGLDITPLKKI